MMHCSLNTAKYYRKYILVSLQITTVLLTLTCVDSMYSLLIIVAFGVVHLFLSSVSVLDYLHFPACRKAQCILRMAGAGDSRSSTRKRRRSSKWTTCEVAVNKRHLQHKARRRSGKSLVNPEDHSCKLMQCACCSAHATAFGSSRIHLYYHIQTVTYIQPHCYGCNICDQMPIALKHKFILSDSCFQISYSCAAELYSCICSICAVALMKQCLCSQCAEKKGI